jgi:Tfp pilus assembly protein PilP
MKSALKGIEMKLIQILALATAMAAVASAQNPSANSQGKASPTPTPAAAAKTGGTAQPATQKAAGTKASAGTPAKATTDKSPAAKGASAPSASSKPAVKAATVPVKAHAPAGTQAKGVPTPVVAAQGPANATSAKKAEAKKGETKKVETKKADTKKADTKKGNATKAPAVIAVKPAQGTKKTGATAATKTPAKAPAAKVTQVGPATQPAEKPKPAARTFGAHGRRDPFVSPIVAKDGGINRPPSNCTSGKRCLVIPELILQGTIKDTSGKMMAVVANSIKKTYFLRENDQVFQGSVEKITSDSIIFREYVKDGLGRETAREVVKKLVPAS